MASKPQRRNTGAMVLLPLALLLLLGLTPPETRGASMAGCALLVALLALLAWPGRLAPGHGAPLLLLPLAAAGYAWTAAAPGAVVEPLALPVIAAAAALSVSCLPRALRCRDQLPAVLAAVAAVVSAYAIYQAGYGLDAVVAQIEAGQVIPDADVVATRARGGRAFALFPTPAALAGYLAMTIPVTVYAAVGHRGAARALLGFAAALQLGGLLAAASAAALGALALAFAFTLVAAAPWRWRLAALVATPLVALALAVLLRGGEVTTLSDPNSSWRLRAGNYRIAAEMIADRPWIGAGPGGYGELYPGYRRPGDNETRHAHNLPLELSAELGLPVGLLLSVAFYLWFLVPLLRPAGGGPGWWRGVEVGLAAFALHSLADFTAFLPSVLWTAALLRGWIVREPRSEGNGYWIPAGAWAVTALAAALAAFAGLAADARAEARQLAVVGRAVEAEHRATLAVRLAPWDIDGRLLQAQAALALVSEVDRPSLEQALHRVDRVVRLSPVRPVARDLRARLRGGVGDLPGALADASRAAELYPMKTEYTEHRETLARLLRVRQGAEP